MNSPTANKQKLLQSSFSQISDVVVHYAINYLLESVDKSLSEKQIKHKINPFASQHAAQAIKTNLETFCTQVVRPLSMSEVNFQPNKILDSYMPQTVHFSNAPVKKPNRVFYNNEELQDQFIFKRYNRPYNPQQIQLQLASPVEDEKVNSLRQSLIQNQEREKLIIQNLMKNQGSKFEKGLQRIKTNNAAEFLELALLIDQKNQKAVKPLTTYNFRGEPLLINPVKSDKLPQKFVSTIPDMKSFQCATIDSTHRQLPVVQINENDEQFDYKSLKRNIISSQNNNETKPINSKIEHYIQMSKGVTYTQPGRNNVEKFVKENLDDSVITDKITSRLSKQQYHEYRSLHSRHQTIMDPNTSVLPLDQSLGSVRAVTIDYTEFSNQKTALINSLSSSTQDKNKVSMSGDLSKFMTQLGLQQERIQLSDYAKMKETSQVLSLSPRQNCEVVSVRKSYSKPAPKPSSFICNNTELLQNQLEKVQRTLKNRTSIAGDRQQVRTSQNQRRQINRSLLFSR